MLPVLLTSRTERPPSGIKLLLRDPISSLIRSAFGGSKFLKGQTVSKALSKTALALSSLGRADTWSRLEVNELHSLKVPNNLQ
ncbi:unnamed protein product [Nezara viridula]|uniref:Uncharacterized protein n=1 Tax=Nezara viridula TaxID=85310 RepID=A0A9P0HSF2_NEZVI|nr:unnamed protein product [Nezara viridula]